MRCENTVSLFPHRCNEDFDAVCTAGHDVVSALPGPASCRAPQRVSPGHHPGVGTVYPCNRLRGPGPRKTLEQLQETASAGSGWPARGRGGRASPAHPRHEASASGVSHRACSRDASTAVSRPGSEACGTTTALPQLWCVPRAGAHSCLGWRQSIDHVDLYGNHLFVGGPSESISKGYVNLWEGRTGTADGSSPPDALQAAARYQVG